MVWFIFAIFSALGFAFSNILEKFILDKKVKNPLTLFISGAFLQPLIVIFILPFILGDYISLTSILFSCLAGFLVVLSWVFIYLGLVRDEASRVIAIFHVFPIFVVILSVLFLKESISLFKIVAILVAVLGAILISLKRDKLSSGLKLRKIFWIALAAAAAEAFLEIIDAHVLTQISTWQLIFIGHLAEFFIAFICFCLFKPLRQGTREVFSNFSSFKWVTILHLVYFLSTVLFLFAVLNGVVSSVSAVTTVQPLFVFILALILSRYFPGFLEEKLDKKTVILKIISIVLIIVGILGIVLQSS